MLKWASFLFLISACGFPRPADVLDPHSCANGICTDPAYPFCDEGGELSGTANTCVAVACTPGDFATCRGDAELSCNSGGTTYDAVQCARGCDPTSGCRLCEPNQTVCANGKVQACDATGAVTSSEACALGCFEDQPRCREIAPSNGLAPYMDMAASGPDLALEDATLSVPSDVVTSPKGGRMTLHSITVAGPPNGVPIHVFPVRSLSLTGVITILSDGTGVIPAVAFAVYRDVRIDGTVAVTSNGFEPPGAITAGVCVGTTGIVDITGVGYFVGSGGGGGANRGGNGGGQYYSARPGGAAFLNPDLQPLQGGCSGGAPATFTPGFGGGAIQITSRSSIHLGVNSAIEANGIIGFAAMPVELPGAESTPGGGGAGGGILLEAPLVVLGSGATLTANGGAGTSGDWNPASPTTGRTPSFGGNCTLASGCTRGGHGGSIENIDTSAPSIVFNGEQQLYTGAGGGSVGYIRINTSSGVYTKANDAFESPIPSTGNIATR